MTRVRTERRSNGPFLVCPQSWFLVGFSYVPYLLDYKSHFFIVWLVLRLFSNSDQGVDTTSRRQGALVALWCCIVIYNLPLSVLGRVLCLCLPDLAAADREKWEAFISGQLADTNKRNTVDLVSHPPPQLQIPRPPVRAVDSFLWMSLPKGEHPPHPVCQRRRGGLQRQRLPPGLLSATSKDT